MSERVEKVCGCEGYQVIDKPCKRHGRACQRCGGSGAPTAGEEAEGALHCARCGGTGQEPTEEDAMDHAKVEFYEDAAGEWRWRLKSANGEIIATGESHGSEADAVRAFAVIPETADVARSYLR